MSVTSDRPVNQAERPPEGHNVVTRDRVAEHLQRARYRHAMERATTNALEPLLPLRAAGNGVPLFCAHPVIGLGWCHVSLLPYLAPAHPVYTLQSPGLRRPEPLPATLAEAARGFADGIEATQPDGPYHLFGWSLGGNVAFAVAEELERRGREVGLLTILDSVPIGGGDLSAEDEGAWQLYNFVLVEFGYVPSVLPEDSEPEARALATIGSRRGLGLDGWPQWRIRALLRIVRHNVALAQRYRPGSVRCPVLLVTASRLTVPLEEKLAVWRPYVHGPLHTLEVPCEHQQLMLPDSLARIGPALSTLLAGPDTGGQG